MRLACTVVLLMIAVWSGGAWAQSAPTPLATPEVLATMPHWVQVLVVVMSALGAIVAPASLAASFLSNYVRVQRQRGLPVSSWMLAFVAATNAAAFNPHKAVRLAKAAKGAEVTTAEPTGKAEP